MSEIPRRYGTADSCSEEELATFVADVRAKCEARLAELNMIESETLPPDLLAEYEAQRQRCLDLLALTEPEAVELHESACEHAGPELTQEEARALVRKQ